jgi:hypothetical protein
LLTKYFQLQSASCDASEAGSDHVVSYPAVQSNWRVRFELKGVQEAADSSPEAIERSLGGLKEAD